MPVNNEKINEPIQDVISGDGGWDNSANESSALAFATESICVLGFEQVVLYVVAGATSTFTASSVKVQNSNDGAHWANVVHGTDGLNLQVGTIALDGCAEEDGPAVATITPKVGKWLSTYYLRVVGEVPIQGVVAGLTVTALRLPGCAPMVTQVQG